MRLSEILKKKSGPRPLPKKGTKSNKGDILKFIDDLKKLGLGHKDILSQVKAKHGSDFLKIAEKVLSEATRKIPLTKEEREGLRGLLASDRPIQLVDLIKFIDDDELNQKIQLDPDADVRAVIRKWLELNMPDFDRDEGEMMGDGNGIFSPVHGYTVTDQEGTTGNF